jgi:hypothetical protein
MGCYKEWPSDRCGLAEAASISVFGTRLKEIPLSGSCSERKTELRHRQKRRAQVTRLKKRLGKATKSEKVEIARKLRAMTPGAEVLIANWGLIEVDR